MTGDAPFQPLHPLRYWGYQVWSGIGSDLQELALVVTLITGLVYAIRAYRSLKPHLECHEETCKRWGFHRVEGTPYRTCWHHHPLLSAHDHHNVPLAHIHNLHRQHSESATSVKEES